MRVLYLVLLGMLVLTALGGIGLLERMSPAIGLILEENVASARAVETMLGALAQPDATGARGAFFGALEAAEANVTEEEERAQLTRIRASADAALAGDDRARRDAVEALLDLGAINRDAMHRADHEARRLGSAGRWAIAFLALMGIGAGVVAMRQARRRVLDPIAELATVVRARRGGDLHRRCRLVGAGAIRDVLTEVNELLDRAERAPDATRLSAQSSRAVIAALLDRSGEALAVMDADGAVVAASRSALDRIADEGASDAEELAAIEDGPLRLVRLEAPA